MAIEEENKPLFTIRPLTTEDRNWVAHFLDKHWASTKVVSRGKAYYAHLLPGFVAELSDAPEDAEPAGLITYRIDDETKDKSCEVMTVDAVQKRQGVGTALLDAMKAVAKENGCKRLWLIITNDNMEALTFYQKRGFSLVAVHAGSLAESRKLKPQIPLVGKHNIPLRDEIELELKL